MLRGMDARTGRAISRSQGFLLRLQRRTAQRRRVSGIDRRVWRRFSCERPLFARLLRLYYGRKEHLFAMGVVLRRETAAPSLRGRRFRRAGTFSRLVSGLEIK